MVGQKMNRPEKPTIIFLVGVLLAALVFGAGKANTLRVESNLRELQDKCIEEGNQETLAKSFGGVLVCDPVALVSLDDGRELSRNIQTQLAATQRELKESESWSVPAAVVILLLSCLPWAWYFLLRRVKELREAIMGK